MVQQQIMFTVSFTVESTLTFTANVLPNAVVGQAYTPIAIGTVSGGVGPYTFAVTGGLPSGMSLSSTGVLSGTPTATGTSNITGTITDTGA